MALPIETVLEDPELRLRWLPGHSRSMVVAFTGRHAQFAGQPADEFARSAHGRGGRNNVLFVSDLTQSWYSRPGLWERIVEMVKAVIRSEGIQELVALGNSMGGFGALLLPRDVPVRRAIAFAPQISMDPAVIAEDRWQRVQRKFGALPVSNIGDTVAQTKTQYYISVGERAPRDLAQIALMPDLPRVHRWVLPDCGHDIAERLKRAGLLQRVVAAAIQGRKAGIDMLYDRFCARVSRAPTLGD